ncbi:hypothetical protein BTVI_64102 [Pitangus sulphuratus]|nr:hypothetical protein BTVI_64102 [Pitangus sulphuratus]
MAACGVMVCSPYNCREADWLAQAEPPLLRWFAVPEELAEQEMKENYLPFALTSVSFSLGGSVTISYPYSIKKFEDMDEWRTDDNQILSKTFWLQKMFQDLMPE